MFIETVDENGPSSVAHGCVAQAPLGATCVRLGACQNGRVQVPPWWNFPPITESNCEPAMPRGEQLKVNRQPVEMTRLISVRYKLDSA